MAKKALLIGVSQYEAGLPPLTATPKDVAAMLRVLQNPELGAFDEVKTLIDPDLEAMQTAIDLLFQSCQKGDLGLLYFSGHGITDDSDRLYLATRRTSKDTFRSTAVSASFIQGIMRDYSYQRQHVLILDCCYSGAFAEGWLAKGVDINLKPQFEVYGSVVLTSSTSTQKSYEDKEGELSLYTNYIVQGIESGAADLDGDGFIMADELHEYAKRHVQAAKPAMKPEIYGIRQGIKIRIAKARVDAKLEYLRLVERYAENGEISFVGQDILEVQRERWGLSDEVAIAIENEVLEPFRKRLKNLERYEKSLERACKQQFPLTEKTLGQFKDLREFFGLRHEDVQAIQNRVFAPYESQEAQELRQAELLEIIANAARDNSQFLDLSSKNIRTIPPEIVQLTNLQSLNLNNNQLSIIPEEIIRLSNLKGLHLSHNQISIIPDTISQLSELHELYLSHNQISIIPDTISQLSNLRSLALENNQICVIPDVIAKLSRLEKLSLDSNQITIIPNAISQLSNLHSLTLNSNQITTIPEAIIQLAKLEKLDLQNNSLPIPEEILNDCPVAIFDFWEEREKKPLNEAKVILVGQGTVGKTSLVKRLLDDQFDLEEHKTEGINIRNWEIQVKSEKVKLRVWDFGGQEIMHATHQFFLTERSLYLLVINTREEERANRIEYWLKLIESFGKNAPVIIVGNKIDDHPLDLNELGLRTKYPNIKKIIGTSCLKGNGIEELKEQIVKVVADMPDVFDSVPVRWLALKDKLEKDDHDYITYDEYQQKCLEEGITKVLSQHTLIRLLHELGIVLNFSNDRRLKDTNVLNPEWVTGGVYKIINDNKLITEQKGVLRSQDWSRIFKPKSHKEHNCYATDEARKFILDIMEKFELCFPMKNSGDQDYPDYLIPDILPKGEPYTGTWDDCLSFEYHYDKVLPSSVISRFIVKTHHHISRSPQPTYWRTGVILASKDNNKAYIKADLEDAKIFVRISGNPNTRRSFLSIIRDTFDTIHELPTLTPDERIPLPDNPTVTVSYQHLLKLEDNGETNCFPEKADHAYNIRKLLDGIERVPVQKKPEDNFVDIQSSSTQPSTINIINNVNTMSQDQNTPPKHKRNPWTSGSFFLFALLVITAVIAIISQYVPPFLIPVVIIGGILSLGVIGAFQLRNDEGLTEANFMMLMLETYKRLPFLKQDKNKLPNEKKKK